jgi:hypothetical protein
MPTTVRELLDAGMPALGDQATARAYGYAYLRLTGSPAAPSLLGSYYRRVGVVDTNVRVANDQATVGPGVVMAVQSTDGEDGGEPLRIVLTRPPRTGEVRVEPQPNGTQRLTFYPSDTIATVAVYGLWAPAEMIAALDSTP